MNKYSNMKTALCAIAKMENKYIRDFVEYYKRLGITHIFLFDNNDINGEHFEDVINDYIQEGYVTLVDVRGAPPVFTTKECSQLQPLQPAIYTYCYNNLCKNYDWFMAFDIDEFLTFKDNEITIDEFLSQQKFINTDVIYINWMCFGDSDKLRDEPGVPIYKRLTKPIKDDNRTWKNGYSTVGYNQTFFDNQNFKSIVRTNIDNVKYYCAHRPEVQNNKLCIKNPSGEKISKNNIYTDSVDFSCAYLRHYVTKTISEWIENKMQRGYPDMNNEYYTLYPAAFFRHGNEWTIEKQEIIDKYIYENYIRKQ